MSCAIEFVSGRDPLIVAVGAEEAISLMNADPWAALPLDEAGEQKAYVRRETVALVRAAHGGVTLRDLPLPRGGS